MKIVSEVLGVARSNLHVRARRSGDWRDGRRGRQPRDDAELVAEIKAEIAALPSYGYRRAWTMVNRRRDQEGRRRVNHKRVYRVMRDHHLLLRRHTGRPIDTRSHEVGSRSARVIGAGARTGSRSPATIGSECGLPLPWTAAIEKR